MGEKILTNAVYVTPEELKLIRYVEYQSDILVESQSLLNKEEKVKSKTQCNRQMSQKQLKSIEITECLQVILLYWLYYITPTMDREDLTHCLAEYFGSRMEKNLSSKTKKNLKTAKNTEKDVKKIQGFF